jgi:3-oxoacyl-[acyl-carrier-protein] synthase-3
MTIGIEHIASYFPSDVLSAAELASRYGFDEAFVRDKLGVGQVFVAAPEERTSDLATSAVRRLLEEVPDIVEQIGVLVVCTQTPDYQLPHVSAMVQDRAGLPSHVAAFDVSLGCSGWVYGLSIVQAFMQQNALPYGVLVTAETYSKVIDDTDRNTKCLFSDAAAATLIGPKGKLCARKFTFGTAGRKYDHLIVRPSDGAGRPARLHMDGRGIFDFVLNGVPADIEACLAANELRLDELDWLVFHQASGFLLDALGRRLGIPGDPRIVRTIDRHGNAVSSSIPLALAETLGPDLGRGARVLVSGFGVGLSWASTVLEAGNDYE